MKKIPDHATKVFEGVFFSVWQWEQKMYDGSTKTFEYIKRPDVCTIIAVTEEGKLLFLEEEQPAEEKTFTFSSGTVDEGEEIEECAKRELLEETGFTSPDISLSLSQPMGSRIDAEFHIFIAKKCRKITEQKLDPGERIIIVEKTLEDILEIIEDVTFKNQSIYSYLIKAKYDEGYRKELKELLGITT